MPGRVLIVDDDPAVTTRFRSMFSAKGVRLDDAPDPASAAALLDRNHYCAILLDLVLDGGSGHDVLRHLRERGRLIPTIVITQQLPSYVREMLSEEQVKLVFTKPIDPQLVVSIVIGLCGLDNARR